MKRFSKKNLETIKILLIEILDNRSSKLSILNAECFNSVEVTLSKSNKLNLIKSIEKIE